MLFKTPALSAELETVHPELRQVLVALSKQIREWGFPELVVTHLHRTAEQQEEYKWRAIAKQHGLSEKDARAKARRKFSWHRANCGADLRRREYSSKQLREIRAWLYEHCPSPMWEFIDEEEGGTAPHFHLARQDFDWRRKYDAQTLAASTGAV